MPRTRPSYPPEFRAEAVELIRSRTKGHRELCRDLGISDQTLRNWVRQADVDAGRLHDGRTTGEREELRRLRAENRTLRMAALVRTPFGDASNPSRHLLRHLVRDGDAQRGGCCVVDDELEGGRQVDRQIGRFGAFQDVVYEISPSPPEGNSVRAMAHGQFVEKPQ